MAIIHYDVTFERSSPSLNQIKDKLDTRRDLRMRRVRRFRPGDDGGELRGADLLRAVVDASVLPGERAGGADRSGRELRREAAPVRGEAVGRAVSGGEAVGVADALSEVVIVLAPGLPVHARPTVGPPSSNDSLVSCGSRT